MTELIQKGPEGKIVDGVPSDLNTGFKYFGNRLCPFAHRAWWASKEKGVSESDPNGFEYFHIDLGAKRPDWYDDVNPLGTVPALFHDGHAVFESNIVAEYLEEKFPNSGTRLMPADPLQKATVRLLMARFGDTVIKPGYALLLNPEEAQYPSLTKDLRKALVKFNAEVERFSPLKGAGEGYLLGDLFTLADIVVAPFLVRFQSTLKHYRHFELLPADGKHDRLRALLTAVQKRPAFQVTTPPPEFFVQVYQGYAKRISDESVKPK